MSRDADYMGLCLALAEKGRGLTSPNPLVGAVIVKNFEIIGRGFHRKFGGSHAEIEALASCTSDPSGSTLYVNFEPCCHQGKTPPCTDAILRAGISRVVIGTVDPNPRVAGKGIAVLSEEGIQILNGVREKECRHLNRFFAHWITTGKPYVIAKAAVSADWKIAARKGERTSISGFESIRTAHTLREECDAVLVGADTVLVDDPLLTVRHPDTPAWRQPLRIILDSSLRIPLSAHILDDANVLFFTTQKADKEKKAILKNKGIQCVALPESPDGRIDLGELLTVCGARGITSILVEGGAKIFESFIQQNLINEWHVFQNIKTLGNEGVPMPNDFHAEIPSQAKRGQLGDDTHIQWQVQKAL